LCIRRAIGGKLNKKELITQIAHASGLKKKEVAKILAAFMENIAECLAKGEKVVLRGFGTFRLLKRKARVGINPRTKEKINLPPSVTARFQPAKKLKEQVK
jgi:DNA-binding protein HU-beta